MIRVFAVRMKKAWVLSYPLSAPWKLWSDWADAQADLSLRWAHMPFSNCWFCHVAAHMCPLEATSETWLGTGSASWQFLSNYEGCLKDYVDFCWRIKTNSYSEHCKVIHPNSCLHMFCYTQNSPNYLPPVYFFDTQKLECCSGVWENQVIFMCFMISTWLNSDVFSSGIWVL